MICRCTKENSTIMTVVYQKFSYENNTEPMIFDCRWYCRVRLYVHVHVHVAVYLMSLQ